MQRNVTRVLIRVEDAHILYTMPRLGSRVPEPFLRSPKHEDPLVPGQTMLRSILQRVKLNWLSSTTTGQLQSRSVGSEHLLHKVIQLVNCQAVPRLALFVLALFIDLDVVLVIVLVIAL